MTLPIIAPGRYRHYKGDYYRVLGTAVAAGDFAAGDRVRLQPGWTNLDGSWMVLPSIRRADPDHADAARITDPVSAGTPVVVYLSEEKKTINVRPYAMFTEAVDMPEYGYKGPRFARVDAD